MVKFRKGCSLALIFTLIGVFLCQNLYALRVPIEDKTERLLDGNPVISEIRSFGKAMLEKTGKFNNELSSLNSNVKSKKELENIESIYKELVQLSQDMDTNVSLEIFEKLEMDTKIAIRKTYNYPLQSLINNIGLIKLQLEEPDENMQENMKRYMSGLQDACKELNFCMFKLSEIERIPKGRMEYIDFAKQCSDKEPESSTVDVFQIGKVNSDQAIINLTEIGELSIKEIERKARPWICCDSGDSMYGFIGPEERLIGVLLYDNILVRSYGFTHSKLAEPLLKAMNCVKNQEKGSFEYNNMMFNVEETPGRGWQNSIFNDNLSTNRGFKVKNTKTGEIFSFSELVPSYIMNYGFYEGTTPYRLDPVEIMALFFPDVKLNDFDKARMLRLKEMRNKTFSNPVYIAHLKDIIRLLQDEKLLEEKEKLKNFHKFFQNSFLQIKIDIGKNSISLKLKDIYPHDWIKYKWAIISFFKDDPSLMRGDEKYFDNLYSVREYLILAINYALQEKSSEFSKYHYLECLEEYLSSIKKLSEDNIEAENKEILFDQIEAMMQFL